LVRFDFGTWQRGYCPHLGLVCFCAVYSATSMRCTHALQGQPVELQAMPGITPCTAYATRDKITAYVISLCWQ